MAKSTILEKWEELFGTDGEPSGDPTAVAGINDDTDSTTRLVNSSLSPFRNFSSALDDGWNASKPMPVRATQSVDGTMTINHGDIAILWNTFAAEGSNAVAAQDDVGTALNSTAALTPLESYGNGQFFQKAFLLADKIQSNGARAGRVFGEEKVVRGKYRISVADSISDWDSYTNSASLNMDQFAEAEERNIQEEESSEQ